MQIYNRCAINMHDLEQAYVLQKIDIYLKIQILNSPKKPFKN